MKVAIAAFAKTIGLSPVKTRLAAEIGEQKAEEFYRLSVAAIEEIMLAVKQSDPDVYTFWALAEESAVRLRQWQKLECLWTGEGGLGTRLANISEALFTTHDAVIFIGTDSPQISPAHLAKTVEYLNSGSADCVFGPALDGGFYLFGTTNPVSRDVWENVTYSTDTTLAELQGQISMAGLKIQELEVEQDVDQLPDLAALVDRLQNDRGSLLLSQVSLLKHLLAMPDINDTSPQNFDLE
ncbi:MAG: TIGR04282 family arsenosugar biosynthesis glycosyltransferase [Pseudomonadota bacterium]